MSAEERKAAGLDIEGLRGQLSRPSFGNNLHDISQTTPGRIREGLVFRSSHHFSWERLEDIKLRAALDLREEPRPCRKATKRSIASRSYKALTLLRLLPRHLRVPFFRSKPLPCGQCSDNTDSLYRRKLKVFHVNLLPVRTKLRMFYAMPCGVRLKTCCACCACRRPAQVMAPAMADPDLLGEGGLYIIMMDESKKPIARALRVFADGDKLPCILHCTHGKDRTGLVVALLLLMLGVDAPTVVGNYARAALEAEAGQNEGEDGKGAPDGAALSEDAAASTARTMEATLDHLKRKHGGIDGYLRAIGIKESEVSSIRKNLLMPSAE